MERSSSKQCLHLAVAAHVLIEPIQWEESLLCPFFHPSNCAFPDDDLLCSLVDLYFDHVNLFTPLLHRPTFDRLLLDKIHVKDSSLGSVVLLVCAIGARFSDDPRVFFTESTLSAGWQWFDLAHKLGERPLAPASLFDIQASVVSHFLQKSCHIPIHLTRLYSYALSS